MAMFLNRIPKISLNSHYFAIYESNFRELAREKRNIVSAVKRERFLAERSSGFVCTNNRRIDIAGIRARTDVASIRRYTVVNKKIVPKKIMAKLTEQERSEQLQPLLNAGWTIVNNRDAIYKEYIFSDFNQAFRFMAGVALLAEKLNHHPEWFNVYNKVQVTMSTHDVGGLSSKDIRMAKYMEEQAGQN